jgi:hypothetical protein
MEVITMESYYTKNGITVLCSGWTGKVKAVYRTTYKNGIRYDIDVKLTESEINDIINNGTCKEIDFEELDYQFEEFMNR